MTDPARRRSLWAWGWRDKFPDDAARAGLVQLARAMLPTAQPTLRPLPPDDPTLRSQSRGTVFVHDREASSTRPRTDREAEPLVDRPTEHGGEPSLASPRVSSSGARVDVASQALADREDCESARPSSNGGIGLRRAEPVAEPGLSPPAVAIPDALAAFASQEPRDRAAHARGRAFPDLVAGFRGDYAGAPDLVVRPRDAAEVARVLEVADARGWAVVPFGGGTSVVGGVDAAAARGDRAAVVSLDLEALSAIAEVDATSRLARIGAGALGPALEAGLATHGLTLRHFPQSFEFSTLGGWLATRAGGHYATGPTRIDELCHALTVVTPRGRVDTHRHPSSGAGPEPQRLWLGSEGALGVITEAWVRVVPRPRWRASATAAFTSFDDGVACARALAQSGLQPSNARLLDPNEARLHRVRMDGRSVLLIAFESADHPMDAWLARAVELARDHHGEIAKADAGERGDAESWKKAFFDAPYLQSALLSIGVISDTFETACTWSQFPALHESITSAVGRALDERCGGGIVACRFTHVYPDGPAPYYTFVGAARGDELAIWREIKAVAGDALAAAGGTITHHHAVGRTHRPWYDRERPALFADALRASKHALDPNGILNPGVLVGP